MTQERIRMSTDPRDLCYRLRLTEADGVFELAEEELTSTRKSANVTETRTSALMTVDQATWLRDALDQMLKALARETTGAHCETAESA